MKINFVILLILCAAAALYTWHADRHRGLPEKPAPLANTAAGEQTSMAPDFTVIDLQGRTHRLSDFRGRGVVVNFWASWCAPCVIEFPAMIKLAALEKDRTIFLFLSQDSAAKDIRVFLKRHGAGLPLPNVFIALDEGGQISRDLYKTFQLPETYLIGHDGILRGKVVGADIDWTGSEMRQRLSRLFP